VTLDLARGAFVGGYALRGLVGRGAASEVWAATSNDHARRRVALKLFAFGSVATPRARERLLHEARIAGRIVHSNVCRLLDQGFDENTNYLALEWVDGLSLKDLRALAASSGVPLDAKVVLCIALDAAAGLHAAHELVDDTGAPLGVVHRDVSAGNLLIGTDGRARVSDFGIARSQDRSPKTTTGIVRGTLRTIAPEQAMGLGVDIRADVFSLAAVVFDALVASDDRDTTGPLFAELAMGGASAWPSDRIPRHLTTVLRRGLARHPDARQASARELANDLAMAAARDRLAGDHALVATYVQTLAGGTMIEARRRLFDEPL
jgi:eukaryotic-like serine/threonine-protein kinase